MHNVIIPKDTLDLHIKYTSDNGFLRFFFHFCFTHVGGNFNLFVVTTIFIYSFYNRFLYLLRSLYLKDTFDCSFNNERYKIM